MAPPPYASPRTNRKANLVSYASIFLLSRADQTHVGELTGSSRARGAGRAEGCTLQLRQRSESGPAGAGNLCDGWPATSVHPLNSP